MWSLVIMDQDHVASEMFSRIVRVCFTSVMIYVVLVYVSRCICGEEGFRLCSSRYLFRLWSYSSSDMFEEFRVKYMFESVLRCIFELD